MEDPIIGMPVQTPTSSKKPILAWVLVTIFIIMTIAGFGLYAMTQKQLQTTKNEQVVTQKKLAETQAQLDATNTKLKAAVFLPSSNEMSPQCSSSTNSGTKLAPLNNEPIDGYNVYLVNCIGDMIAGKPNTNKVIAFKVGADGKQTFVFGAGSGEPYCISGKIIANTTAATNISKATGIPVCKTF